MQCVSNMWLNLASIQQVIMTEVKDSNFTVWKFVCACGQGYDPFSPGSVHPWRRDLIQQLIMYDLNSLEVSAAQAGCHSYMLGNNYLSCCQISAERCSCFPRKRISWRWRRESSQLWKCIKTDLITCSTCENGFLTITTVNMALGGKLEEYYFKTYNLTLSISAVDL